MRTDLCGCGAVKGKASKACNPCEFARRSAERVARKTRICVGCGSTFVKSATGGNKGLYCSRECAFADPKWQEAIEERNRQRLILSADARRNHREIQAKAKLASRTARAQEREEAKVRRCAEYRRRMAEWHVERQSRPARPCRECGKPYVSVNDRKKFCSERCMRRRQKRIDKGLRRARLRGLTAEQVDPIVVFARDGWRCQLCGCRTPKGARGSSRPEAPELDHIIPLALGGIHHYVNTQCACRRCNGSKGATIKGQLRLCGLMI